jgi:hypothetical protein
MRLPKYSMGVGDRFAHQGLAQLSAMIAARKQGVTIAPVWNKSFREHGIVGTTPGDVRREADAAVKALDWTEPYFVDADHVRLKTVDGFLESCDFFTLDVAEDISADAGAEAIKRFTTKHKDLIGRLDIPGMDRPLEISEALFAGAVRKFLAAAAEAGRIWRHIEAAKGADNAVVEVSMDETDSPQTPAELLVILAALADQAIPIQTIAPRFTGEFLKGVDYIGPVERFNQEFAEDLAIIAFAVRRFGLPDNLKLSIHSGSDKFSIYRPMHKALQKFNAGVHLKTAGTTWLEELIGLAAAGGDGLAIAKEIHARAFGRLDELCAPYASVVKIERAALPCPDAVDKWEGPTFAAALRHDQTCKAYNPNLRQLLHVGYKVAAEMGAIFTAALEKHAAMVGANVTENIYQRHIRPLFLGE